MQKLVCDRCGLELTDREDINLALEGKWAWEAACRARSVEPRGILPCKNYVRCGGRDSGGCFTASTAYEIAW